MRRIVFQLDDRPEVQGEIGIDNEGNLYLRGDVGKSIRLLQDSSIVADYVPETANLVNVNSVDVHSGGYVVAGKQCIVTLLFTKDTPDGDNPSSFDVTLPLPASFTGDAAEAVAAFTSGAVEMTATSVPGDPDRVTLQWFSDPFTAGVRLFQASFCYRIK